MHLDSATLFPPTRAAALERLQAFVPKAGKRYAAQRNADPGPGLKPNVSMLSPYLRYRMLTEQEVLAAVLAEHSPTAASMFVQEVFWRTYWKGWLQMRPQVWRAYHEELARDQRAVESNAGRARALHEAMLGQTGIACFDDWAQELRSTGYLHNHARMWFASIWIFTLKLPWTLGAAFFLEHLLDADPASNTLGWRWVAGIQTQGKTYLADPENIERFTNGRYSATALAKRLSSVAAPIREEPAAVRNEISPAGSIDRGSRALVLIHGEDLQAHKMLVDWVTPVGALVLKPEPTWPAGDKARGFLSNALEDTARDLATTLSVDVEFVQESDIERIADHARSLNVKDLVVADAPIGPVDETLLRLESELKLRGISLIRIRRRWDELSWPCATKGFFPFKKQIPRLLEALRLPL